MGKSCRASSQCTHPGRLLTIVNLPCDSLPMEWLVGVVLTTQAREANQVDRDAAAGVCGDPKLNFIATLSLAAFLFRAGLRRSAGTRQCSRRPITCPTFRLFPPS